MPLRKSSSALTLFASALICVALNWAVDTRADRQQLAGRKDPHVTQRRPKYAPGEVLVRFKKSTSAKFADAVHERLGARVLEKAGTVEGLHRVAVPPDLSVPEAVQRYREDPSVLYAQPNHLLHALGNPDDPQFARQWNLLNTGQDGGVAGADIRAPQAWNLTTGSSNVVVAVIDTGIDIGHPDLLPNLYRNSVECTANGIDDDGNGFVDDCYGAAPVYRSGNPQDDNGHGSHVAGTIGAAGNNNLGVSGVNWNVRLLACKFLDQDGYGYESDAIACLEYVRWMKQHGVPIVATNNSWGGLYFSQALADVISAHLAEGILFVAAAGNSFADSDIEPEYPADYTLPNIISVAATGRLDELVSFSNFGRFSVHLGAPGHEILSTVLNGNYATYSGTSMAAPHVAGVAALLKARDPALDWRSIRNLVLAGAQPLPTLSGRSVTGGRLDAYGALTCSNSSVRARLLPNMSAVPGAVGKPVTLAALNIICGQPAGTVNVTVQPGSFNVALRDDGFAPDLAAGDGTYSAEWSPPAIGSYTVLFPGGDDVQIVVLQKYEAEQSSSPFRQIMGTSLDMDDDGVKPIDAPFPVLFGGGSFSKLYISANGTLSFTNAFDDFQNGFIPVDYWRGIRPDNPPPIAAQSPVVTLVAPFWDDLYPRKGTNQNVFWEVTGTAPNRELVVEWRDISAFECRDDVNATIRFQAVFLEGSTDVLFLYDDARFGGACSKHDFGNDATVGVQVSQLEGTRWGHPYAPSSSVGDHFGLRWRVPSPSAPNNPQPTISSLSPDTFSASDGDTMMTVNGSGFVPGAHAELDYGRLVTYFVSATQLQVFIPTAGKMGFGWHRLVVFNPPPGGGWTEAPLKVLQPASLGTLTSLSPDTIPATSFSFTLTLYGTGFVANFTPALEWDFGTGSPILSNLPTQYVSATELRAIIPAYWLLQPGVATVRLSDGANWRSNGLPFTVSQAPASGAIVAPPGQAGMSTTGFDPARGQEVPAPRKVARPPYQFLGWKAAQYLGPEYALRFLRPRANLALPPPALAAKENGSTASQKAITQASVSASPPLVGFEARIQIPTDFLPSAVDVADFNGDGHMDWVIANDGSNTLWMYMGHGDGTWQLPSVIPLKGYSPTDVKAADMNADGKPDLVVAESDTGSVSVLLGNGDGTFGLERQFFTPAQPLSLAITDFNADGVVDVVAGMFSVPRIGPLAFLPGLGGGRLGPPVMHYGQTQSGLFLMNPIRAADLNNDGLPDIVGIELMYSPLSGGVNPNSQLGTGAQAFLNQGNGEFKRTQLFDISHGGYQWLDGNIRVVSTTALGDVNHDGCVDAVNVDYVGVAVTFLGKCDGTFDRAGFRMSGTGTTGGNVALVDVNHDGNLDLLVSGFINFLDYAVQFAWSEGVNLVSVSLGDGAGNFAVPRVYRGLPGMFSFVVADLNEDTHPDLITVNQDRDSATVFFNDGTGGFGGAAGDYVGYLNNRTTPAIANSPLTPFALADVNGDGRKDLVYIERGAVAPDPGTLSVLLNTSTSVAGSHFNPALRSSLLDTGSSPFDFTLADFRNTGRPDVLLLSSTGILYYYALAKNNGDGTFSTPNSKYFTDIAPRTAIVGDFNGDGKLDFVVPTSTYATVAGGYQTVSPRLVPFLGIGDGTFARGAETVFASPPAVTGAWFGSGFARDFNRDGKLDLLLWGYNVLGPLEDNAVYLILGNGDGTFQSPTRAFNNFLPFTLADVNEDGMDDIVAVHTASPPSNSFPYEYAVYLGQSDASFQPGPVTNQLAGLFQQGFQFGSPEKPFNPGQPMVADFNGDGHLDIAGFSGIFASSFGPGYVSSGAINAVLQVLAGRGDGTFVSNAVSFDLGRNVTPQLAIDLNGDNWADLVEFDGYSASYHVLRAQPAPSFSIARVSDPILGNVGKARIFLASARSTDTTILITTSDPNLTAPANVTLPAGTISADVDFQIGSSFDPLHVISIEAKLGNEAHAALFTKARTGQNVGVFATLETNRLRIPRGGTTGSFGLLLASLGGYETEMTLSCRGLPSEAFCVFASTTTRLPAGNMQILSVQVATLLALPAGDYTFSIEATDGDLTKSLAATVSVGDFQMSITPASVPTGVTGTALFSLHLTDINNYGGRVTLTCSQGLPPGATCRQENYQTFSGYTEPLVIATQDVPTGSYSFAVSGTSGPLVRTVTATFVVNPPSASGGVGPNSATVSVGSSAIFSVALNSQNGASGSFTFSCVNPPTGVSCSFNPNPVGLPANSSVSSALTVSVTSRPAQLLPPLNPPVARWPAPTVTLLVLMLLLLLIGVLARRNARRWLPIGATVLLVMVAMGVSTCGGGGGGSVTPPPPPPPPPAQPVVVSLPIRATSSSMTVDLGTITLTVR